MRIAFLGDSGRRFARIAGVSLAELLERVDTTNLLPSWPGRLAKGDAFPLIEARRAAANLAATDSHRVWILAGKNVARAFGLGRLDYFEWVRIGERRVAVVPHPSGVSRWWNKPGNTSRARLWLRALIGGTSDHPNRFGAG